MNARSRVVTLALLLGAIAPIDAAAKEVKSRDFTAADQQGKALVLLSTSAEKTSASAGTLLHLSRVLEKDSKVKSDLFDGFYLDNPFLKSHSASEHMNVHWRALEPGQYVLERQLVNPLGCFKQTMTLTFTLVAGQRAYLGDLNLAGGTISPRDSYARDYAFFVAHTGGEKPESFTPLALESKLEDNPTCTGY